MMKILFCALLFSSYVLAFEAGDGSMKKIKTADSVDANIFLVRSSEPTKNFLFLFHEWWGLNDNIKQEARKLQKALPKVNVVAVDLYDGKVTDDPKIAGEYVQQMNPERAASIIKGAIAYAGSGAKIASLGWCFGGGWSLQSALLEEHQAAGCVIYYGMPEKNIERLKTLQCNVLGIFGTQDGSITPEIVKEFENNMKEAKKKLEVRNYNAPHAFANPSNPKYDKTKTEDAYKHTVAFLKKSFGL